MIPAQTGYASNDPHNFYYDYATRSSGGHRSHDHHRSGSHGGFNRPSSAGATRKHSSGGYGRSNAGTTNIFVGGRGMGHSGSGHGGSSHREQYARPTTQEQLHQQQQQYYRQQHQQQQMHQQQGAYQNQNPNNVQQQQQFHQQQQYSGSSKQQFSGSGNGPSYPSSNAPNAPTYFGDGGNSGGGAHTRTRPMSAGATMSSGRQQSQQQVKTGGQMPSTAVNVAESVKDANGGSNTTSASGNPTVAAPAAAPITIPTAGVVRPTSASGGGTIKASYKPQNGNVVSAEGSGEDTMEAAGLGEHSGLNGQNQANRQKGSSGEGNFVDDEEEDPELNGSKRRSGKNHPGSIDNSQSRTTHPEVSSTISNLGNGTVSMDIRSVESSFLEDGRVPASIGLTTLPNQFCSINEAIELRKLLLMGNNNARGGIIPSSTAVMDMYMVGKVIGVGSYGKVRAAWHRLTGSKVAIKTYDKAKLKDPAHWKRVHSEIKITEQTSHPRIARLFEAIETPKRMHLIMECLDGGNLCSYVKQKRRLSEDESKRIFFQLVQSIDYLHIMGVAHRDIKLENVLFNDHKDIKLIDFGFSTVCQPGKKLRVFCGTPSYMAPGKRMMEHQYFRFMNETLLLLI